MKRVIFLSIACLSLLTACEQKQFALDTATVAASLVTLDEQYTSVELLIDGSLSKFTRKDRARLKNVGSRLDDLRQAAHAMINKHGGLAQAMVRADEVKTLFEIARDSYRQARAIIEPRLDKFDVAQQVKLTEFDTRARRLGLSLDRLLTAADGTDITPMLSDALTIAGTAVKFLLPLLL